MNIYCYFEFNKAGYRFINEVFEVLAIGPENGLFWEKSELDLNLMKIGHVVSKGLANGSLRLIRKSVFTSLLLASKMDNSLLEGQLTVMKGNATRTRERAVATYCFEFCVGEIHIGIESSNTLTSKGVSRTFLDLVSLDVKRGSVSTTIFTLKDRTNPRQLRPD